MIGNVKETIPCIRVAVGREKTIVSFAYKSKILIIIIITIIIKIIKGV